MVQVNVRHQNVSQAVQVEAELTHSFGQLWQERVRSGFDQHEPAVRTRYQVGGHGPVESGVNKIDQVDAARELRHGLILTASLFQVTAELLPLRKVHQQFRIKLTVP